MQLLNLIIYGYSDACQPWVSIPSKTPSDFLNKKLLSFVSGKDLCVFLISKTALYTIKLKQG